MATHTKIIVQHQNDVFCGKIPEISLCRDTNYEGIPFSIRHIVVSSTCTNKISADRAPRNQNEMKILWNRSHSKPSNYHSSTRFCRSKHVATKLLAAVFNRKECGLARKNAIKHIFQIAVECRIAEFEVLPKLKFFFFHNPQIFADLHVNLML